MCRCNSKRCNVCELRKARKREVKLALQQGRTVPYELRTLIEDGWSVDTVRKVYRSTKESSDV